MAIFLTAQQVYRVLQRELPEGVYPDGAPSTYFSTADSAATASGIGDAYTNLGRIYSNMFPATADEQQNLWETMVFGYELDPTLSLAIRQGKVISKLQSTASLSMPDTLALIYSIIGTDKLVEIIKWQDDTGGWLIGVSQLGVSTWLGGGPLQRAFGSDLCKKTWTDFGLTQAEWLAMRQDSYTYEVRIYNYTLTAQLRTALDVALTAFEKATSTHVITDGLTPPTAYRDPPLTDVAETFFHFVADDYFAADDEWNARTGGYAAAVNPAAPAKITNQKLGFEGGVGTFGDKISQIVSAGFEVPAASSLVPGATDQWTVEIKFKLDALLAGGTMLFAHTTPSLSNLSGTIALSVDNTGRLRFILGPGIGGPWLSFDTLAPFVVAGNYYLLTFVFSNLTRFISLYSNGALFGTQSGFGIAPYGSPIAHGLSMGMFDSVPAVANLAQPVVGQLIELAMTSRALTATEIAARAIPWNAVLARKLNHA